ncbi:MAG: hypothetical protein ACM3XO_26790 [Bacteroidota bacterium]
MKIISIFLGLINALLAGLLITFLLTSMDFRVSTMGWSITRILLTLSVILISVLSWMEMGVPIRPGLLALGSLFLVAIGPASMVWAFHRASLTGHMEYHRIMYWASLLIQGISLGLGILRSGEESSTP